MYDKDGVIIDRREQLRVKIRSLAAEARIIRHEEHKTRGVLRDELHRHRVIPLRHVARNSHIAYGLIRGRKYEQMEAKAYTPPDWKEIKRLIDKYGPAGGIAMPAAAELA